MARPRAHLAISLVVGAVQLLRTRRLLPAVAPLLTGFLIDADHLVDFAHYRARAQGAPDRMILPLHGWEYAVLLAWLEARPLRGRTGFGLTLSYLAHLALDQATNEAEGPLTYLFLYRAARRFHGDFFTGPHNQHAWRDTPARHLWKWL